MSEKGRMLEQEIDRGRKDARVGVPALLLTGHSPGSPIPCQLPVFSTLLSSS